MNWENIMMSVTERRLIVLISNIDKTNLRIPVPYLPVDTKR